MDGCFHFLSRSKNNAGCDAVIFVPQRSPVQNKKLGQNTIRDGIAAAFTGAEKDGGVLEDFCF